MYLIFDTETTGLPKRWNAPISDTDNWPRCVQIAWQLHDDTGKLLEHYDALVQPEGFNIPYDAEQIHGISTALAAAQGKPLREVLEDFEAVLAKTQFVVGQNVSFDLNVMGAEFFRISGANPLESLPVLDTCTEDTAELCQLPGGRGGKFKLPTLTELHAHLFGEPFKEAHNASADVEATARCFLELVRTKSFSAEVLGQGPGYLQRFEQANPEVIPPFGLKHKNLKKASEALARKTTTPETGLSQAEITENEKTLEEVPFAHLHNHSQFSVLQSTIQIKDLVAAATEGHMPAVALTDHANMMGAFHFVKEVNAYNKSLEELSEGVQKEPLIPILGCEFFVCEDRHNKSVKDYGYQIVMLAKNKKGYHNLAKMSSIAYTEGFYYVPRIDREVVQQYKDDLIVLTGNLYGEVPSKILNQGEKQAEEALLWWKAEFGEDLYVELMRHGQEDEDRANTTLVNLARKHNVSLVASNNTYYRDKEDAEAHDILLCVKEGEKQATPVGRGRGYRFGLPNQEYYFKSQEEMKELFRDLPESIVSIQEIIDKVTPFELARDVLLPKFEIPAEFQVAEDLAGWREAG